MMRQKRTGCNSESIIAENADFYAPDANALGDFISPSEEKNVSILQFHFFRAREKQGRSPPFLNKKSPGVPGLIVPHY